MATTNYSEWEKKFTIQANITVKADMAVIREACDILFERIVKRTPVGNPATWHPPYWPKGYVPGSLRDGWQIEEKGDTIVISNNLPYAVRVENGWSQQAPEGMMKVSVLEFEQIINQLSKRRRL